MSCFHRVLACCMSPFVLCVEPSCWGVCMVFPCGRNRSGERRVRKMVAVTLTLVLVVVVVVVLPGIAAPADED